MSGEDRAFAASDEAFGNKITGRMAAGVVKFCAYKLEKTSGDVAHSSGGRGFLKH